MSISKIRVIRTLFFKDVFGKIEKRFSIIERTTAYWGEKKDIVDIGSCNNFPELLENLNEDFGTLLDCLNLLGERVIPLYYFDADNFGDISDEDFRTVIDICKKYKVRYYRDSKNKGKDSGFRIFWGETSINNEKVAISAVNAEKKLNTIF